MNIRIILASAVVAGAFSLTAIAISGVLSKEPVPPAIAEATLWTPDPLSMPQIADYDVTPPAAFHADNASPMRPLPLLQSVFAETALPEIEPPLITWSREIASGETLDAVLANAGIAAPARAEIALALGAEYDLRRLRPGHEITVIS